MFCDKTCSKSKQTPTYLEPIDLHKKAMSLGLVSLYKPSKPTEPICASKTKYILYFFNNGFGSLYLGSLGLKWPHIYFEETAGTHSLSL